MTHARTRTDANMYTNKRTQEYTHLYIILLPKPLKQPCGNWSPFLKSIDSLLQPPPPPTHTHTQPCTHTHTHTYTHSPRACHFVPRWSADTQSQPLQSYLSTISGDFCSFVSAIYALGGRGAQTKAFVCLLVCVCVCVHVCVCLWYYSSTKERDEWKAAFI